MQLNCPTSSPNLKYIQFIIAEDENYTHICNIN